MITYFPEIYPDELLYSVVSRFYVKSGYVSYPYATKVIFQNPRTLPNKEFCNTYTPDFLRVLTRDISKEEIILNHTMFSYHYRFRPKKRRLQMFTFLNEVLREYSDNKPPIYKTNQYLKYCPICAKNDLNMYGEAFWHRVHQIPNIVCPIHKCFLINSDIATIGKMSLKTADECCLELNNGTFCNNEIEIRLSQYIAKVFELPINLQFNNILKKRRDESTCINTKIKHKFKESPDLYDDFISYYKPIQNGYLIEPEIFYQRLQKNQLTIYEIYMLAMFLDIPPEELAGF